MAPDRVSRPRFARAALCAGTSAIFLVVIAGCGSSASTPAAHAPATSPAVTPSSVAPSPSPTSTAKLTISQARRVYVRIVDPSNRILDAITQDYTDQVPMAQFRHDQLASIVALRKLAAVRWPARVGPYVRAMLSTDVVADIRCARDQEKVSGYNPDEYRPYGQACTAAQNTNNADTIRSLLHFPPLGG